MEAEPRERRSNTSPTDRCLPNLRKQAHATPQCYPTALVTNAPHDALFKTSFGHPEHAAAELRHILPGHVAARIDWATLTPQPGSYVDEELADQHSDLLFSAAIRATAGPVFVYVLFEHQSTAQHTMALRLLRYMVRIWTRHANDHPELPLPLIIPAVLAHVPGGWTAPTRFAHLFSASVGDIAPGVLPDFQYVVDDLHRCDDDDLRARTLANAARLSLWLLRDARDADTLLRSLPSWAADLESLAQTPRGKELLIVLLRYIARASRDLHLSEIRAILDGQAPTAEAVTMTIEEQLHAEGHARGLVQGLAQGKAEGKAEGKADSVLVLLRARGLHLPPEIQHRIQACTDAETLDRWLVRAATVSDPADVFEG